MLYVRNSRYSFLEPAMHDESKYNCLSNLYIEKKIGKGQFSEVYRAKCLIDNETVALKKIQVAPGFDRCFLRLFNNYILSGVVVIVI